MAAKIVDLHTHTNYSDGDLSPYELIDLAIQKQIGVLAITDHDTLGGIQAVDKDSLSIIDRGIKIIDGIELSASVDHGRMHILGYGIDLYDKNLNGKLEEILGNNVLKILDLIEQLYHDFKIRFSDNDIEEMFVSNYNVKRPHVAKLCVKGGYASSVSEAFDKYLIYSYDKLDKRKYGLSYQECISLINDAGGIAVLAHPNSLLLDYDDLCLKIEELIELGLRGIEAYHSDCSVDERNLYLGLAEYYNLLVSAGTDYHGPSVKPHIEIGLGCNGNVNLSDVPILKVLR